MLLAHGKCGRNGLFMRLINWKALRRGGDKMSPFGTSLLNTNVMAEEEILNGVDFWGRNCVKRARAARYSATRDSRNSGPRISK